MSTHTNILFLFINILSYFQPFTYAVCLNELGNEIVHKYVGQVIYPEILSAEIIFIDRNFISRNPEFFSRKNCIFEDLTELGKFLEGLNAEKFSTILLVC